MSPEFRAVIIPMGIPQNRAAIMNPNTSKNVKSCDKNSRTLAAALSSRRISPTVDAAATVTPNSLQPNRYTDELGGVGVREWKGGNSATRAIQPEAPRLL